VPTPNRTCPGPTTMSEQNAVKVSRSWSTADVDQSRALEYWVDTVCDQFLALEIDSPLRNRFHARLEQVDLGVATMNVIQAQCQRVRRTRAKIARSQKPVFILLQLRAGQVRLKQLGHDTPVGPGECVFIDGREPYELECPQATSALALRLPDQWLRRWVPWPEGLPARLFAGSGWSAALNAALATLDADSARHFALPNNVVAEQLAALLALAAGPNSPAISPPKTLDRLLQVLRDRLHESELSPSAVAEENKMSTRSVHYAFARTGTTFMDQLMRLRVERAAEILSDGRLSDLPMTEVAARCGFVDPSHFARRFRSRFGRSPHTFRQEMMRQSH
jgi:AraC family transcriptional regulator, positive regulator of tynA and feaB